MKKNVLPFDLLSNEFEVLTEIENVRVKGGTKSQDDGPGWDWAVDGDGHFYYRQHGDASGPWTAFQSLNEVPITAPGKNPAPGIVDGFNGFSNPGAGFNIGGLPSFGGSGSSAGGAGNPNAGHFLIGASLLNPDFTLAEGMGLNTAWTVEGNYAVKYTANSRLNIDLGVNVPAVYSHPEANGNVNVYQYGKLISSSSFVNAADLYPNGIVAPAGQQSLTTGIMLPHNTGGIITVEIQVGVIDNTGAGNLSTNKSYKFDVDIENPNLIN